jgi:hypothetical protein
MFRSVEADLSLITGSTWIIKGPSDPLCLLYYEEKLVNRSQFEIKQLMGFLCVLLGSSRVQLQNSLGNRRTCDCYEAAFSSPNGDRA